MARANLNTNVAAFLDMLAQSEIGAAMLAESDDGYNLLVGSTPSNPLLFNDYSKHPDILNHALDSTAAGRYQFIHHTFTVIAGRIGLTDFSAISQDLACQETIKEAGALDNVIAGNIVAAISQTCNIWASLYGSTSGQRQNSLEDLTAWFTAAGGTPTGN